MGKAFDGAPDVTRLKTPTPSNPVNAQYNGRLDYKPTDKDLIAFSVYWVPTIANSINGPARQANQYVSDRLSRSWTGIWNRTLSPTLINEARFGLSGWKFNEIDSNPQEPWGLPISNFDVAGSVAVQRFGAPNPGVFDQSTWNLRDILSRVHGSHFFKFGGEYSRSRFLDENPGAARPTFNFRNLWSYANDAPYQESGNFNPLTGVPSDNTKVLHVSIAALFVQDDWKVRPNLTLNLGLRWEYYSPLTAENGLLSTPVLGSGAAALTGLTIRQGGGLASTSKANFGPQVGIAWSPGFFGKRLEKKLVFRGGFGIGFNVQQLSTLSNGRSNPPSITSLTLNGGNILYGTPSDPHQFSGYPSNPAAKQTFDATSGLPAGGAPITLQGFPDNQNTPTTYRYSLDAQYDIGRNWVAVIGYQGSQTRNYSRQRDLNLIYYPDLNPRVNRLFWFSNDAAAHYNALLTQITHRFSNQFTVDAQYRLSRNTDQGSQDYFIDNYPFDINASNGPADFDVTHDFKAWGIWTPSLFHGKQRWLQKAAGRWTLSAILNTHSGFPWTPVYSHTHNNLLYPTTRLPSLPPPHPSAPP